MNCTTERVANEKPSGSQRVPFERKTLALVNSGPVELPETYHHMLD